MILNLTPQALAQYEARLNIFGKSLEEKTKQAIGETLTKARVTIMSFGLWEACKVSKRDLKKAKTNIDTAISPKALQLSGIKPVTELNPVLWRMAGDILKNKVPTFAV